MEQRSPIALCRVCNTPFEKTRRDKVVCSNTCNVRLHRLRKKAEASQQEQKMTEMQLALAELKSQWAEVKRQWSGVKTILQENPINYAEHYPSDERAPVLDALITQISQE